VPPRRKGSERIPEHGQAVKGQGYKKWKGPANGAFHSDGAGVYPRSTFSTAISIFSIAIAEESEFMSGTYHLQGQPS
jgi:hypothetical protein